MIGDTRFTEVLDKTLDALGIRFDVDYKLGEEDEDRFKSLFQGDCDALREVLVRFLVAQ